MTGIELLRGLAETVLTLHLVAIGCGVEALIGLVYVRRTRG